MTRAGLMFYRGFALGSANAAAAFDGGLKFWVLLAFIALVTIWVETEYWAKRRAKQGGEG